MFITLAVCNMFSYVCVLTVALHILSVQCAQNQKCPSSGFISADTGECYCYVNRTLQLCGRQLSKGARFASVSQEHPGQLRRKQISFSARIVGGDMATISQHPYMLAMERWGRLKCGATIIGHRWAVTAAHCVAGGNLPAYQLRAHSGLLLQGGEIFKLIKVIIHEGFKNNDVNNDIALLKVDRPFESGGREFAPAMLPTQGLELAEGAMVTVVGWGNTQEDGYPSLMLQEVQVPVVSYEHCRQIHGDEITKNNICAGYPEGGKDACSADSGGPMMLHKTIVGIVVAGKGCARKNNPGVYTKVSAMRDWIRKKIYM